MAHLGACDLSEDWTDSPLTSYGSAREAAAVYAALEGVMPGCVRTQDYSSIAVAGCSRGGAVDAAPRAILALDVRRDLERAFRRALDVLVRLDGEAEAERLWGVWWSVRVRLVSERSLRAEVPDVARIVGRVDGVVLRALDALELRRLAVSEDRERSLNATPRPRVGVAFGEVG